MHQTQQVKEAKVLRLKGLKQNKLKDNDDKYRIDDYLADKWEYTEGDDKEIDNNIFNKLPEAKKVERTKELWTVLIKRAKQGALIIDRVKFLKGNQFNSNY